MGIDEDDDEKVVIPKYILVLFQYFCDDKKDHIDLSCINEEIKDDNMDPSLRQILFREVKVLHDGTVGDYKINNKKLKRIFPNLVEYRNHMGNWIYVGQHKTKQQQQ